MVVGPEEDVFAGLEEDDGDDGAEDCVSLEHAGVGDAVVDDREDDGRQNGGEDGGECS